MNEIGRTNDGDYLVKMTSEEYYTFTQLERALNGGVSDWHKLADQRLQGSNLSRVLLVIREWSDGLFRINSLQEHLTHLKNDYLPKEDTVK